jgi:hypothetical protein
MLWQKSRAVKTRPSTLLGLRSKSYEAYCLDEAVIFFGLSLENMLQEAGNKPSKADKKAETARKVVLNRVFGTEDGDSGYSDPAVMFQ